ncbi:hypothetical protein EDB19DRAFT_162657 [Suillus lakei]|nr:hypothetical protein EDB19DRAFT_162657 [Suillus lakei]
MKVHNVCAKPTDFLPLERIPMEYSADDIAAAKSLQLEAYLYTLIATFWAYDYVCSLNEEWTFLIQSRWTKVKGLYIITRCVPFCLITTNLYLNSTPNENPNKCRILIDVSSCFSLMSITCSESFFVLRTYALWNNNKVLLVAMLSALFAAIVSSFVICFTAIATAYLTTSAIPGTTGCFRTSGSVQFSMPFLLMFLFALGLVSLTLIRALKSWRMTKGHLHAILVKHNIFYYVCGLLLSGLNFLVPMLFSDYAYHSFEDFQIFILAILATRMHLHLWHIDQHVHSSDASMCISMSDMCESPADHAV